MIAGMLLEKIEFVGCFENLAINCPLPLHIVFPISYIQHNKISSVLDCSMIYIEDSLGHNSQDLGCSSSLNNIKSRYH